MLIVGLDVGSTTVKAAVVDDGAVWWQHYTRHNTKQAEMVLEFLEPHPQAECGLTAGRDRIFVTGSGAGMIAPHLGGKIVQEVVAVSAAVDKLHPEVNFVSEIGGEDMKTLFFTPAVTARQASLHAIGVQRRHRHVHRKDSAQAADRVGAPRADGLRRLHAAQDQLEMRHLRRGGLQHLGEVGRAGGRDHRQSLRGCRVPEPGDPHQRQYADAPGTAARRAESILQGPAGSLDPSPQQALD